MGDFTSPDSLPFPFDTDTPDVPRDIKGLADATQAALLDRHEVLYQGVRRDTWVTITPGDNWLNPGNFESKEEQPVGTTPISWVEGSAFAIDTTGLYNLDVSGSFLTGAQGGFCGLQVMAGPSSLGMVNGYAMQPNFSTTVRMNAMAVLTAGQVLTIQGRVQVIATCNFQAAALRVALLQKTGLGV